MPAATTPCVVCAKPCVGRKTCGDACLEEMLRRRSTIGARTPKQREKRRRYERTKYRGKDKAQVIARLTAEQGGRCKVCGHEGTELGDGKRGLVLDHCHETGRPRAMLCTRCNAALGQMRESPDLIAALWRYALVWAQREVPHVA